MAGKNQYKRPRAFKTLREIKLPAPGRMPVARPLSAPASGAADEVEQGPQLDLGMRPESDAWGPPAAGARTGSAQPVPSSSVPTPVTPFLIEIAVVGEFQPCNEAIREKER